MISWFFFFFFFFGNFNFVVFCAFIFLLFFLVNKFFKSLNFRVFWNYPKKSNFRLVDFHLFVRTLCVTLRGSPPGFWVYWSILERFGQRLISSNAKIKKIDFFLLLKKNLTLWLSKFFWRKISDFDIFFFNYQLIFFFLFMDFFLSFFSVFFFFRYFLDFLLIFLLALLRFFFILFQFTNVTTKSY